MGTHLTEGSSEYIFEHGSDFLVRNGTSMQDGENIVYRNYHLSDTEVTLANTIFRQYSVESAEHVSVNWEDEQGSYYDDGQFYPGANRLGVCLQSKGVVITYEIEQTKIQNIRPTIRKFIDSELINYNAGQQEIALQYSCRDTSIPAAELSDLVGMSTVEIREYFALSSLIDYLRGKK